MEPDGAGPSVSATGLRFPGLGPNPVAGAGFEPATFGL